jgi:uncharacterized membrane protein YoaK (UPF0700 family)
VRPTAEPLARSDARETRVRDALLVALTFSTGAVDALAWLTLGHVFSAFMTGNLVFLGLTAGGAPGPTPQRVLVAVVLFSVGASLGGRIVAADAADDEAGVWRRHVTLALGAVVAVESVFFGLWLAVEAGPSAGMIHVLIAMSALAMGVQTSAIFAVGLRGVFTTAATATVATLMGDVSAWSDTRRERRRLTGVLCGLVAGAGAGGYLVVHERPVAPLLPLLTTGAVVLMAAWRARP